ETRAAYLAAVDADSAPANIPSAVLPADIAAEIARIEARHASIMASQPIERWRFETIRADYLTLLKRAGEKPDVEEALRERLSQVTRNEQAARAARTIQTILARSRPRDLEVAEIHQRLAAAERSRSRTYDAIGFVQRSSRMVEGRRLYALIGSDGKTLAF